MRKEILISTTCAFFLVFGVLAMHTIGCGSSDSADCAICEEGDDSADGKNTSGVPGGGTTTVGIDWDAGTSAGTTDDAENDTGTTDGAGFFAEWTTATPCPKRTHVCEYLKEPKPGNIVGTPPVASQTCCEEASGHNKSVIECQAKLACILLFNVLVKESNDRFTACKHPSDLSPPIPATHYEYNQKCMDYNSCVDGAEGECFRATNIYGPGCSLGAKIFIGDIIGGLGGIAGDIACLGVGIFAGLPIGPNCPAGSLGTACVQP
jgi:hypothetical protein